MAGKQRKLCKKLERRREYRSFCAKFSDKSANEIAEGIRASSDGFLFSPEWRAVREEAIKLYGTSCLCCGQEQTARRRVNIDHVKPRRLFPELSLDVANLQPLCGRCNKRKGNSVIDYRHPV
jgi:hypothetical protein